MKLWVLIGLMLGAAAGAMGYTVQGPTVTGEKEAELFYEYSAGNNVLPTLKILENVVELSFAGADGLTETSKTELNAPHALIRRVGTYTPDTNVVRSRIVLNGSLEGLKDRVRLVRDAKGARLTIGFPKGPSEALNLLRDEQLPLSNSLMATKSADASSSKLPFVLLLVALLMMGGGGYYVARTLKARGGIKGSRKYLIEQMSYCPLGPKTGVSLLKIGNEFILVGVTSQQVTMLSNLKELQAQYASEATLERGAFQAAVEEEFQRLRGKPRMSA